MNRKGILMAIELEIELINVSPTPGKQRNKRL